MYRMILRWLCTRAQSFMSNRAYLSQVCLTVVILMAYTFHYKNQLICHSWPELYAQIIIMLRNGR